jgi:cytochrome c oxidase subunit 3
MDIGTLEPTIESEKSRRKRSGITTGGGNGGNGNSGRGGGGGSDYPDKDADNVFIPNKARVFTWFLLLVVLMTFGGLSAAYIMTATNGAIEWRPFALPIQVWISTTIILISSAVYHRAKVALDDYDQPHAKRWLVATTVLGAAFISSQMLAWYELNQQGLYFAGNPYAGFFYILTGLHALHVLGGIIALGSIVIISWNKIHSEHRWYRVRSLGEVVGWYWHFMGGVWVILFVLLGFWK